MSKPQGFRDDPRFLTSRDKAYKRVVNDTSIFKLDLPSTRLAQCTRGENGGWLIVEDARFYFSIRTGLGSKTTPESKCPELLANYCDMLLRKTPLSKVSSLRLDRRARCFGSSCGSCAHSAGLSVAVEVVISKDASGEIC